MFRTKIWLDDETASAGVETHVESPKSSEPPAKIDLITLLIALFGFGVALYAFIEHIHAKAGGAGSLSCDVNATVSCSNVLTSEFGEFLGIPLGAFGMAFWAGVASVAILPVFVAVSKRYLSHWRLVSAAMGFVTALVLAYISYFIVKSVCLICSTTQVTCVVYFIFALVAYFRARGGENYAHPNAFMRLLSLALALGVPPLAIGLIAPPIVIEMLKKNASTPVAVAATPEPGATPIPAELLTVNKSNYVGKGEDYRIGNDNARTVIHMYSDPECPGCRAAASAFEQVLKTIGTTELLFVEHLYPLDSSCNPKSRQVHHNACRLSLAARCAGQQGKFFEFLRWAYDSQSLDTAEKMSAFSDEGVKAQVKKMGLSLQSFSQCFESKVEMAKIQEDIENATKMKLNATPMIIINGEKFHGNPGDPGALEAAIRARMR